MKIKNFVARQLTSLRERIMPVGELGVKMFEKQFNT
jgi:hypothetical protein